MSYLVQELMDRAVVLGKSCNKDDITKFAKIVYDYVSETKLPLNSLPQVTSLFKKNYKVIKKFCLDELLDSDQFPGRVELLFGLSCFDDNVESEIFNKFSEALSSFYLKLYKESKDDSSPKFGLDYQKAILGMPGFIGEALRAIDNIEISETLSKLLKPKPEPETDLATTLTKKAYSKKPLAPDFKPREVDEAYLLPDNFLSLSQFVFSTLDYLDKVNSKKLKDYCLEIFKNPSRDILRKPSESKFFRHIYLSALDYLRSGNFSLSSERADLKHRLYELEGDFGFIEWLKDFVSPRSNEQILSIITYMADNRLFDYFTIESLINEKFIEPDWETIWPFVEAVVKNYPGLVPGVGNTVSSLKMNSVDDFWSKFSVSAAGLKKHFPEQLLNFDAHFSEGVNCTEVTKDVLISLSQELYSLEKNLKNYAHQFEVIISLEQVLNLLEVLPDIRQDHKDKLFLIYSKFRNQVHCLKDYNELLTEVAGLNVDLDDDYAKSARLICRLTDLVNNNSLNIDIFKCLSELQSSLKSLKNGINAPSIEMSDYLDKIIGSLKSKGVSGWVSDINSRPLYSQLSLTDKAALLEGINSFNKSLSHVGLHIKHYE